MVSKETAKELALISCFIIQSEKLNGTIFQTFDKAYDLAKLFLYKFPIDHKWEDSDKDFDEAIEAFLDSHFSSKRIIYKK